MPLSSLENTGSLKFACTVFILCLLFSSCNITRKAPKGKPYLAKNTIELKGGDFSKLERSAVVDRLLNQLDDSSRLRVTSSFLVLNVLKRPPTYDTMYSNLSAANMRASMYHIGYYNSAVSYKADTSGKKVKVHYTVQAGNPTRIDTFSYRLVRPDLQELALKSFDKTILEEGNPITKAAVVGEIGRLVDTFRNNGYYKFTASELKMRGDTSIAALTTISDDPFEQLQLLAEAQQKRDSPEIKLAMVLDQPDDSSRFNQYRVRKIFILQDYYPGDHFDDTTYIIQRRTRSFVLRYHKPYPMFRTGFLARNISLRPGQLFRQDDYNKTLSSLSKSNAWQSVNIQTKEIPDSNQVDLILELIPEKKFSFEASVEASYSATSNTTSALAGNLIGFSGNLALINKNFLLTRKKLGGEAIRMTHRLRAGVELNNNSRAANTSLINSNELSYSNNVVIPRRINLNPFKKTRLNSQGVRVSAAPVKPGETFINTTLSLNNRLNLFNLQSVNLAAGFAGKFEKKFLKGWNFVFKPLNVEFSYLYNRTDSFKTILDRNPFLRYSYNTALVIGMGAGISHIYQNPRHLHSLLKERSIKLNIEESGLTWGLLVPGINTYKYKANFAKLDAEYKYTVNYRKTSFVFRGFLGVGVPLKKDTSLPFFKQFFGGGTNSMRGWPIRGIGAGGQQLVGYTSDQFNDRRGDMQIELNTEYRYEIARLIPNILTLGGAVFVDAGNVWNLRNSKTNGTTDSTQFKFKNLYNQMGLSAGTGFRLDFNYVVIRFDLGFRLKRPETSYENAGWKLPPIGFDDVFKKIFSGRREYRRWRYENFNFTLGIGVPF
ncbi:MAG: BamA/TamA family outer membrane protein [Rhizobacter sp.]|nr:BamA/TamA family outer membrane protein [Ferruginibacter sp.]